MIHAVLKKKRILIIMASFSMLISLILIFCTCHFPDPPAAIQKTETYIFPYNLNNPNKIYSLPEYLNEISGLSYYKNNKIVCVQDEKGKLIEFDLKNNEIDEKHDFGKDGDFEGIEIARKKVYVLRSDGKIYAIKNFNKKDSKKKEYNTPLSVKNDCEGLGYDSISNSLLIACKGSPSINDENKYTGKKAIYQFDLEEKALNTTPFLLIDLDEVLNLENKNAYEKLSYKLAKEIDPSGDVRFQPSGIAVNPHTQNIYIIASVGNSLIVFNRSGDILKIEKLNKKLFRQPEGICFKPNGDLLISNEGDGGKAKILVFKFQKDN
jgi:uncharacterized protein YjiK